MIHVRFGSVWIENEQKYKVFLGAVQVIVVYKYNDYVHFLQSFGVTYKTTELFSRIHCRIRVVPDSSSISSVTEALRVIANTRRGREMSG